MVMVIKLCTIPVVKVHSVLEDLSKGTPPLSDESL